MSSRIRENRYEETEFAENTLQAQELSDAAREARNAAARAWRKKNKDRVQEYNRRYWERKATQEAANDEG